MSLLRSVKRAAGLGDGLEKHYDGSLGGPCLVPLDPGSKEFRKVLKLVAANSVLGDVSIKHISRVQNRGLVGRYRALRSTLPKSEEALVFHGTTTGSIDGIVRYGFNRSYGVSMSCGRGVYFSNDVDGCLSWSSLKQFFEDDCLNSQSEELCAQSVFLSRMILGNVIVGNLGDIAPPEQFLTFVDSAEPREFVATQDCQAIPEYLIITEDERIAEAEILLRMQVEAVVHGADGGFVSFNIGPLLQQPTSVFVAAPLPPPPQSPNAHLSGGGRGPSPQSYPTPPPFFMQHPAPPAIPLTPPPTRSRFLVQHSAPPTLPLTLGLGIPPSRGGDSARLTQPSQSLPLYSMYAVAGAPILGFAPPLLVPLPQYPMPYF